MDKLKPLLTHKFWIFFVVAMLMPTAGWWMATGELIARIDEQQQKIEGTKPYQGKGENPTWVPPVTELVEDAKVKKERAAAMLQGTQQQLRVWPKSIAHLVQDVPYFEEIKDVGDIKARDIREWYGDAYFEEVKRLREILNPFDPETNQGTVILDPAAIPFVPEGKWDFVPPSSQEMWEVQEDLWLFKELFLAIADMNEGAEVLTDTDCAIREILELRLMGGDPSKRGADAKGGPGGPGGGDVQITPDVGAPNPMGPRQPMGSRGVTVDVDPKDVFGPDQLDAGGASGPSDGGNVEAAAAPPGVGAGARNVKRKRYVDDEEGVPFKTRGFKISVIMDHTKVPEFLVRLTNSKWPIEIVHVNQVAYNPDDMGGKRTSPRYRPPRGFAGGGPGESFSEPIMEEPIDPGFDMAAPPEFPGPGARGTRNRAATGGSAVAAMADPFLAHVVILGLMTIYDPPPEEKLEEGQAADDAAAPQQQGQTAPGPSAEEAPAAESKPPQDDTAPAKDDTDPAKAVPGKPAAKTEPKQAAPKPEEKSDTPTETPTEPDTSVEKKPE